MMIFQNSETQGLNNENTTSGEKKDEGRRRGE